MNSPTSTIPLFGQAWELTITYATQGGSQDLVIASTTWQPEALRITFDVLQAMNSSPLWYADIAVYNLNDATKQNILLNATWATLKAGFMIGQNRYSTIWSGSVFQTIFTREDVVDQKVTLHCVASPRFTDDDILAFSMGPFSSQQKLLATIASDTELPPFSAMQGTLGTVAEQRLAATQYPRGNTVFGRPAKFIAQLADSNFLQSWQDGSQAYLSEVFTDKQTPDLIYAPPYPPGSIPATQQLPAGTTQSLTGTPQQIQQGVVFTVLLDPRLRVGLPPQLVQLVRLKSLNAITRNPDPNSEQLPTALSANLTFFVTQVRHVGDTRGNDWHTEVTGYSTAYAQILLDMLT